VRQRRFDRDTAERIRVALADPGLDEPGRRAIAGFARRVAEKIKGGDPAFDARWFVELCGLGVFDDVAPLACTQSAAETG
jgi:hypothetical protein